MTRTLGSELQDNLDIVLDIDHVLDQQLARIAGISGVTAVLLVDSDNGMVVASQGSPSVDTEVVGAFATEVIRSLRTFATVNADEVTDTVIRMGHETHLLRTCTNSNYQQLFFDVVIEPDTCNLDTLRNTVRSSEVELVIWNQAN